MNQIVYVALDQETANIVLVTTSLERAKAACIADFWGERWRQEPDLAMEWRPTSQAVVLDIDGSSASYRVEMHEVEP